MSRTKKVVLAGIFSAMVLILLFISSVFTVFDFSFLLLSGLIIALAVVELGRGFALLMYVAVSILSFFLMPLGISVLLFILFVGYYPVLKSVLEKLRSRVLEYLVKIAVFNVALGASIYFFSHVLFAPDDVITPLLMAGGVLAGNVVFILYDLFLTKAMAHYMYRLRSRIRFMK